MICVGGSAEVRQRLSDASVWLSHDFSRVLVLFSGSRSCWGGTRGREAEQTDACVGRAAQPETLWAPETVGSVGSIWVGLIPEQRRLLKLVSGQKYRNIHYYQDDDWINVTSVHQSIC